MKRLIFSVALLCAFATANATPTASRGWKTYSGAWFVIFYPESFTPVPIQKSRGGVDSVAFLAPSRHVEFYVFSPQWSGHASALDVDTHRERITSKKVVLSDYRGDGSIREKDAVTDTWLGIDALDGSYVRFVHEQRNEVLHTALAFGIKCTDMKIYQRYKTNYNRFRKSLVQYADGLAE